MASSLSQKLSREDYRRQKDLEAARKAGTAPAEQDEQGRDINPHIPQYIARAPWYIDTGRPSLTHQRIEDEDELSNQKWYPRGQRIAKKVNKFRKGACENCGAMTHQSKDCLERPRKVGAKWNSKNMQADEVLDEVKPTSYDAKRDRWNGYDPKEHAKIIEEWELVDLERKRLREKELEKNLRNGVKKEGANKELNILAGFEESSDDEIDEDKYAEASDMVGQKVDTKTRTTVRNLRIREDTAKYLRNLDLNSAYYDPKTRSMRDNPNKEKAPNELIYAGDNFVRYTGDASKMNELQLFAWEAAERGHEVHLQANPSHAELLYKQYLEKKEKLRDVNRSKVLEKYGGVEHFEKNPTVLGQTEEYVEYSLMGKVIKGPEKAKVRSRYEEDLLVNNHTEVWGSYWKGGKWGFKCCGSTLKQSYCTGTPPPAPLKTQASPSSPSARHQPAKTFSVMDEWKLSENALSKSKTMIPAGTLSDKPGVTSSSSGFNFASSHHPTAYKDSLVERQARDVDDDKLQEALMRERERLKRERLEVTDETSAKEEEEEHTEAGKGRKRIKYNSAYQAENMTAQAKGEAIQGRGVECGTKLSKEELEAYQLLRRLPQDPMKDYRDDPDQNI